MNTPTIPKIRPLESYSFAQLRECARNHPNPVVAEAALTEEGNRLDSRRLFTGDREKQMYLNLSRQL